MLAQAFPTEHINRSYCWESVLCESAPKGIALFNHVFHDTVSRTGVNFDVVGKPASGQPWRQGYWQDPTWQRPPSELGEQNEVTRRCWE